MVMTDFEFGKHGFKFPNSFRSRMWIDLPGGDRWDLASTRFGLCGGMTYAALDSFLHEQRTGIATESPGGEQVPPMGGKIRGYLWDRQMDSLERGNWWAVKKLMQWMLLPVDNKLGVTGLRSRTRDQFRRNIRPRIDRGKPVPLMLVLVDGVNPFKNHQVLAIGYEEHQLPNGRSEWDVITYDPNRPNSPGRLHMRTRRREPHPRDGSVRYRGFFMTRYSYEQPYWV